MTDFLKFSIAVKASEVDSFEAFSALGQNVSSTAEYVLTKPEGHKLYVWSSHDFYPKLIWGWDDIVDYIKYIRNCSPDILFVIEHMDGKNVYGEWVDNPFVEVL